MSSAQSPCGSWRQGFCPLSGRHRFGKYLYKICCFARCFKSTGKGYTIRTESVFSVFFFVWQSPLPPPPPSPVSLSLSDHMQIQSSDTSETNEKNHHQKVNTINKQTKHADILWVCWAFESSGLKQNINDRNIQTIKLRFDVRNSRIHFQTTQDNEPHCTLWKYVLFILCNNPVANNHLAIYVKRLINLHVDSTITTRIRGLHEIDRSVVQIHTCLKRLTEVWETPKVCPLTYIVFNISIGKTAWTWKLLYPAILNLLMTWHLLDRCQTKAPEQQYFSLLNEWCKAIERHRT